MLLKFQVPELYFYRTKRGKNRKTTFFITTVRDCKADEGLSQHRVRRRKTATCENKPLLNSTCPLTTHARELQRVATVEVSV